MDITSTTSIWEKRAYIKEAFPEDLFLVMRRLRYGLGSCANCKDPEASQLEWDIICWLEQSAIEATFVDSRHTSPPTGNPS